MGEAMDTYTITHRDIRYCCVAYDDVAVICYPTTDYFCPDVEIIERYEFTGW